VGLAYQINKKTVIRSAYGIFYNSTFVQELQDMRKFLAVHDSAEFLG